MGAAAKSKTAGLLAANLATLMATAADLDSQQKLARRCKMDQRTVGRILNRTNAATLPQIDKLAAAFGLEPWQLLVPGLHPTNPPILATESAALLKLLQDIGNTKEAIDGYLRERGNTRPADIGD